MAQTTGIEVLEACIARVWSEKDPARRLLAMRELYHPNATIYEPARAVSGHPQISDVVGEVLKSMPEGFRFEITGQTQEHHGIVIAHWRGVADSALIVSGSDVARLVDGLIHEHWFFFDPKE